MKTEEIVKIPVISIMDMLGIKYFKKGNNEYWIYDSDGKTSWWSFNTSKNIVSDFSKDRPSWDSFWFVKSFLKISDSETFKRFEDKFWIHNELEQTDSKKPIRFVWEWLKECNDREKEYIKWRWVDYEKVKDIVKDYNWGIACLLYTRDVPKWLRARWIDWGNSRFFSLSWYDGNWIYMHNLDESLDYLIVVEGMFDFLTLRQHTPNVIWLGSAQVWFDEVKRLSQRYKIIFCPDNDTAGKESIEKMNWIRHSIFELSKYWNYKDINDLYKENGVWTSSIVDVIIDESKAITPIQKTFDKFIWHINTIKKYGKLWFDWPAELKQIFDQTSWVIKWKVYTIAAYSNVGKSKLAYFLTQDFIKLGKKVLFVSLEVWEEMCLQDIMHSYHSKMLSDDLEWNYDFQINKFSDLEIRDDMFELQTITDYIEFSKPDICVIDFSQNIQAKGYKWYEKNAEIAVAIQRTAIKTWTTIFQLSQISNEMAKSVNIWMETTISLKGAWEYYSSSDVIFIMRRWENPWELVLRIEKNKFWYRDKEYLLWVDYRTNRFHIKTDVF